MLFCTCERRQKSAVKNSCKILISDFNFTITKHRYFCTKYTSVLNGHISECCFVAVKSVSGLNNRLHKYFIKPDVTFFFFCLLIIPRYVDHRMVNHNMNLWSCFTVIEMLTCFKNNQFNVKLQRFVVHDRNA